MDISALAAGAVSVLAPYLVKTAEAFAGELGKQACVVAQTLYEKIRQRLSSGTGARKLEEFVGDPEGKAEGLKTVLELTLENDPAFAEELKQLLDANAPVVHVIQRMDVAKRILGADIETMTRGRLTVEQNLKHGEEVTGVQIKNLE